MVQREPECLAVERSDPGNLVVQPPAESMSKRESRRYRGIPPTLSSRGLYRLSGCKSNLQRNERLRRPLPLLRHCRDRSW